MGELSLGEIRYTGKVKGTGRCAEALQEVEKVIMDEGLDSEVNLF